MSVGTVFISAWLIYIYIISDAAFAIVSILLAFENKLLNWAICKMKH